MNDDSETAGAQDRQEPKIPQAAQGNKDAGKQDGGRKRFQIDIFRDWCKACGICAAFCPRHCIQLDEEGSPFVEDSSRCTGCGWCELHCPDFAISVRPLNERKDGVAEHND